MNVLGKHFFRKTRKCEALGLKMLKLNFSFWKSHSLHLLMWFYPFFPVRIFFGGPKPGGLWMRHCVEQRGEGVKDCCAPGRIQTISLLLCHYPPFLSFLPFVCGRVYMVNEVNEWVNLLYVSCHLHVPFQQLALLIPFPIAPPPFSQLSDEVNYIVIKFSEML